MILPEHKQEPWSTGLSVGVVELHLPQYLELRKAILIPGPNDRTVLEGRGLQTPLVKDRDVLFGRHSREEAIRGFVPDLP